MDSLEKLPIALIFGEEKFLGFYLKEFLQRSGCELIDEKDAEANIFDYLFILDDRDKNRVETLISLGKTNGAKILLVTNRDYPNYLSDKNLDLRLVTVGDLYGPRMEKEAFQKLSLIDLSLEQKPLFIADAVYGLARAMFGSGTRGKKFVLSSSGWEGIKAGGELNWKPAMIWEEGWSLTKNWFGPNEKKAPQALAIPVPPSAKKKPFFYPAVVITLFFLLAVGYLLFSLVLPGFWGANRLLKIKTLVAKGDFSSIDDTATKAQKNFATVRKNLFQFRTIFSFLNQGKVFDQANSYLEAYERLSRGIAHAGDVAVLGNMLLKAAISSQSTDKKMVDQMIAELDPAYESLSLAQPLLKGLSWEEPVNEIRRAMANLRLLAPIMPELLGMNGRRVYLILFQNNTEVRPTGGFIGSYGILTLDKGGIVDFEVEDVYAADGQLKGHVEPPAELKRYLGEAGWYLRDSNWDPDFPTSALRAAWFLEKEIGRTVDGVIGINLYVAQGILEELGEISLPDFQEKINAHNLFERAEYHSEVNFFPGSTQKKDFLGAVARALFEKIKGLDGKMVVGLGRTAYASFLSKDIAVFANDKKAASIFSALGWDGGLKENRCLPETACFADYLMVVEANVGVNKANYFVKRNTSFLVKFLENGRIEEKLSILYQNSSATEIFPAGEYKNYLRVYLPTGIELKEILMKEPTSGKQEKIDEKNITIAEEHGHTSVGFLVEVPIKESKLIEVTYEIPSESPADKGQYTLLWQKQPGIEDENFPVRVESAADRVIVDFKPLAQLTKEGIVFSPKPNQDLFFQVDWVRID